MVNRIILRGRVAIIQNVSEGIDDVLLFHRLWKSDNFCPTLALIAISHNYFMPSPAQDDRSKTQLYRSLADYN